MSLVRVFQCKYKFDTIYKIQSVNLLDGKLLDRRWPTFTTSFPRRNSHFQRPTTRSMLPHFTTTYYLYLSFTQGEDYNIMLSQLGLQSSSSNSLNPISPPQPQRHGRASWPERESHFHYLPPPRVHIPPLHFIHLHSTTYQELHLISSASSPHSNISIMK